MRQFISILIVTTLTFTSGLALAGDSPLLAVEWNGALAEEWNLPSKPVANDSGPQDALRNLERVSDKVRHCQEFKVRWSESSARKLFRAMRYHDSELEEVDLQPWIEVRVTSQRSLQPFSVHAQNEGRSVGIVPLDPNWTFSYVVAQTTQGPVIASQQWPSPEELDEGATCRPMASRIEFPAGKATGVAIEPFRMWGMRVAEKLDGATIERPVYEAVVDVIRTTDGTYVSR